MHHATCYEKKTAKIFNLVTCHCLICRYLTTNASAPKHVAREKMRRGAFILLPCVLKGVRLSPSFFQSLEQSQSFSLFLCRPKTKRSLHRHPNESSETHFSRFRFGEFLSTPNHNHNHKRPLRYLISPAAYELHPFLFKETQGDTVHQKLSGTVQDSGCYLILFVGPFLSSHGKGNFLLQTDCGSFFICRRQQTLSRQQQQRCLT